MHSDSTPGFASHLVWWQGLSRRKSERKSPQTEHLVCTHLQYLHTSRGQISIGQKAPVVLPFGTGWGLDFGAVLFELPFGDTCSVPWRGQKIKKEIRFPPKDGKNTRAGLSWRSTWSDSHFGKEATGASHTLQVSHSAAECCRSFSRARCALQQRN